MMDCIMNRFLKENYPNTVAINTDEFGINSEVSIPDMLNKYSDITLEREYEILLELKSIVQIRKYIKKNILKKSISI